MPITVVSSKGLPQFIATGKGEEIPELKVAEEKPKEDAQVDAKDAKVEDKPVEQPEVKAEEKPKEPEEGLEPEDMDLQEKARRRIGKKHAEMKSFQALAEKNAEIAAENERFAESQYNERRAAEKRADEAERKLAEIQAKLASSEKPEQKEEAKKPDPESFKDEQGNFKAIEYAEALAKYSAEQAVAADRARQVEERQKAEQAALEEAFKKRIAAAIEKYPDFEEVTGKADLPVPPYIAQYITESELGADLAYHFAKNPGEYERIAKMPPIKAIAAIGKLEDKLEPKKEPPPKEEAKPLPTAPVKPVPVQSRAPAPTTPIDGSGTVIQKDPSQMTFKELREYEKAQAAKNRARRH